MATTFDVLFKNSLINSLTGRAAMPTSLKANFIGFYSGAQAANPSATPAGTVMFSSPTNSININTNMSMPSGGVSQLTTPRGANATNAITASTARIYGNSGAPIIDTPVTLDGGGGGVIVPTLTSIAATAFQVTEFSVRLSNSNGGTLLLNNALRDALVSAGFVTDDLNIAALSTASIRIYSGAPPESADLAATGTLLLTITTAAAGASWVSAAGGSAALTAALSAVASATGTAGYARIVKGTYVMQGSVGTSAADFVLDTLSIVSGATHSLTNATITI